MTRDRLTDAAKVENAPTGRGLALHPGQTATFTVKDKQTGEVVRQVDLIRTSRPYVDDLCEAYNASMSPAARDRGCRWEVTEAGELKLGFPQEFTSALTKRTARKSEADRRQFNHRQAYPIGQEGSVA